MSKKTENRIRIKDIAERAKVSVGTVDRVLHNRGEVAEETRKQIMSIVEDLGYTPNLLAKSLASKKLYRIAVIIPEGDGDNSYWDMPLKGINQAQQELKDFNTSVEVFTFDLNRKESFSEVFEQILKMEPDGIVFTPLFYSISLSFITKCEETNTPYAFLDVQLESCSNLTYYGQDAVQSGRLAAKLMHYGLPENAKVLILKLANREGVTHHLKRRAKGFLEFFSSNFNTKNISTLAYELDLTDDTELFNKLNGIFAESQDLRGIFVTNSKVFRVAAWLESQVDKEALLIGYDLVERNIKYLEEGVIDFLIGQKPEEQGYKCVNAMFNYLVSQKETDRVNYSSIDIIMKENIDYYKRYKF